VSFQRRVAVRADANDVTVEATRQEAVELVDQLEQTLARLAGAQAVADGLGRWVGQGTLVGVTLSPPERLPDLVGPLRETLAGVTGEQRLIGDRLLPA
jgi:hypothetical protein